MTETPKEFGPTGPEVRMADDSELSDSDNESDYYPELTESQPSIAADRQICKSEHPDTDSEEECDESKVFKSEPDCDVTDEDDVINDPDISLEEHSEAEVDIRSSSTKIKVRT